MKVIINGNTVHDNIFHVIVQDHGYEFIELVYDEALNVVDEVVHVHFASKKDMVNIVM